MDTISVLRSAADLIERHGWSQRKDVDPNTGGICANGAIRLALGSQITDMPNLGLHITMPRDRTFEEYRQMGAQLQLAHAVLDAHVANEGLIPDNTSLDAAGAALGGSVIVYNDYVAQTGEHVVAVFRAAADRLEEGVLKAAQRVVDGSAPLGWSSPTLVAAHAAQYDSAAEKALVGAHV